MSIGLLMTACGGSGGGTVAQCKDYWFGEVGACLPEHWNVIDRSVLSSRGVPEDTIVAFQAKDPVSGQFPTITVTREPLAAVTDPVAYSDATIRSVAVLPNYAVLDQRQEKIDGTSLSLMAFSAQPVSGEPQRRFYQVSTVVGKMGYTVTAVAPLTVTSALENEILTILGSVTFVAPEVPAEQK